MDDSIKFPISVDHYNNMSDAVIRSGILIDKMLDTAKLSGNNELVFDNTTIQEVFKLLYTTKYELKVKELNILKTSEATRSRAAEVAKIQKSIAAAQEYRSTHGRNINKCRTCIHKDAEKYEYATFCERCTDHSYYALDKDTLNEGK